MTYADRVVFKRISITYYEPGEHYDKWHKPIRIRQILCKSTYIKYLKQSDSCTQKLEKWLKGVESGDKVL